MFAARCVGVSLAMFVLAYVLGSLAIVAGWRLLLRLLQPASARATADVLFAVRIFPLGLALATTLGVALPSFLLLEPHATDEAVGTAPLALAAVFLRWRYGECGARGAPSAGLRGRCSNGSTARPGWIPRMPCRSSALIGTRPL